MEHNNPTKNSTKHRDLKPNSGLLYQITLTNLDTKKGDANWIVRPVCNNPEMPWTRIYQEIHPESIHLEAAGSDLLEAWRKSHSFLYSANHKSKYMKWARNKWEKEHLNYPHLTSHAFWTDSSRRDGIFIGESFRMSTGLLNEDGLFGHLKLWPLPKFEDTNLWNSSPSFSCWLLFREQDPPMRCFYDVHSRNVVKTPYTFTA